MKEDENSEFKADKVLAHALMHLIETAANDGRITAEESELFDKLEFSLRFFRKMLIDALEDGIITENERKQLIKMKDRIIDEGFNVAQQTDGVSKDEMNMLISIMLSLKI